METEKYIRLENGEHYESRFHGNIIPEGKNHLVISNSYIEILIPIENTHHSADVDAALTFAMQLARSY